MKWNFTVFVHKGFETFLPFEYRDTQFMLTGILIYPCLMLPHVLSCVTDPYSYLFIVSI